MEIPAPQKSRLKAQEAWTCHSDKPGQSNGLTMKKDSALSPLRVAAMIFSSILWLSRATDAKALKKDRQFHSSPKRGRKECKQHKSALNHEPNKTATLRSPFCLAVKLCQRHVPVIPDRYFGYSKKFIKTVKPDSYRRKSSWIILNSTNARLVRNSWTGNPKSCPLESEFKTQSKQEAWTCQTDKPVP